MLRVELRVQKCYFDLLFCSVLKIRLKTKQELGTCQNVVYRSLFKPEQAIGHNNNNNNNKHDNVYGAVIMAEPLREFTRFI